MHTFNDMHKELLYANRLDMISILINENKHKIWAQGTPNILINAMYNCIVDSRLKEQHSVKTDIEIPRIDN